MTSYKRKFRLFGARFIAISLGSFAFLFFLRWMVTVKSDVVRFKPLLWYYLLPIFSGIACWYFMRQLVSKLALRKNDNTIRNYFIWVSVLTTVLTVFFSQHFITDSQAALVTVENIDEIPKHEKATYFDIRSYTVPSIYVADFDINSSGGRWMKTKTVTVYFLFPITFKPSPTANNFQYWYALKFSHVLGRISDKQGVKAAQQFLKECKDELRDFDFNRAKFFERLPDSHLRDRYLEILSTKVNNTSGKEILFAHTKPFVTDDFTNGALAALILMLGSAMFFIGLSFVEIKHEPIDL